MDLHLRDRVYLVTGGSRGLGFAGAEVLVAEGARVVVSSPGETSAAAAAARLANGAATADSVAWIAADNGDAATPERLITTAEDRFGRLDGALVSVGGTPPGTVATTPDDAWRGSFESVFLGAVRLARLLGMSDGQRHRARKRRTRGHGRFGRVGARLFGAGAARGARGLQRSVPGSRRRGEDARRGSRAVWHSDERDPAGKNRDRKSAPARRPQRRPG
jgi:NAD(P)-dependent dehydrogenase (short-subunit alcohol dehydrogenase family)